MSSTRRPGTGQQTAEKSQPKRVTLSTASRPLCTSCAYPIPHVYTTYTSKSNIRLGVCPRCDSFLDPLIESPSLVLALDLVLLKPRVFLHLLFNRGSPPLDASGVVSFPHSAPSTYDRRTRIWRDITYLSLGILLAEIAVRRAVTADVTYVAGRVVAEMAAQLLASTALTLVILRIRGWYPDRTEPETVSLPAVSKRDGRQEGFLPSLVPLVLLYTALLPLLLQLILGIWYDSSLPSSDVDLSTLRAPDLAALVGPVLQPAARQLQTSIDDLVEHFALLWQHTDRVWAGTRILGGMSAGFGLRVLLPTRPWETTMIVMFGWVSAVAAGRQWDALWA